MHGGGLTRESAAPLVVPQPVLSRVRPDAVAAARRIFDRAMFDASANAEARETLGGRYLVNTLRNLPRILASPDLRAWADSRRGQPAVVCGAGPSLNRNLDDLRPYRDRVVLIAVDTALRPILEAGFEPDLVVALDPSPLNARHVSGLQLPERTWLVSEAALDPTAFDSFGDRVAFFRVGDNDPWPWLGEHGVDVPVLAAWGSVLTSAFALAEWLGCDPVCWWAPTCRTPPASRTAAGRCSRWTGRAWCWKGRRCRGSGNARRLAGRPSTSPGSTARRWSRRRT